jgi:microsomal epoxide hydrolase
MPAPPEPRPFAVDVPDQVLDDLAARLERVRWPDEIPGAGWTYGTDLAYLQELVAYWRAGYDWRAAERALNGSPQSKVEIDGIDLHYLHVPGQGPAPLPLVLAHGWPGSVFEFSKIIPRLTDPARFGGDPADAFTVVAPSLPGYGFSFRPGQRRVDLAGMASIFAILMTDVLGYDRYGAQGGDWGAAVVTRLGLQDPHHLAGIHLNLLFARPSGAERDAPEAAAYRARTDHWRSEETGYQWIQGTKPQTLAYALTDSPAGLAGWIVEKFRTWSDCDGDVERRFTKDELLTNVMIYWVTGAIGSSFWPYYATRHGSPVMAPGDRVEVPTGFAAFPREIVTPLRAWAERSFNITRWTEMPAGGHFAALEEPEALAAEVQAFFRDLR